MPIEVRREQVLDAALRLIGERGYGAVTMEAIAREANVAKPVVYNAYPGLGPLLQALLAREEARGLTALLEAMPDQPVDGDASATLLLWLRSLAAAIARNPAPWRLMLIPPDETPEVVREHVQAGRSLALGQVRGLTRKLLGRHPSLQHLDEELAAQAVLAIAEHAAKLLINDPDEYPPERLVAFGEALLTALGLL
jgi:AcrR family transcriptional regulator